MAARLDSSYRESLCYFLAEWGVEGETGLHQKGLEAEARQTAYRAQTAISLELQVKNSLGPLD